jgi:hypothetical protein
MPSYVELVARSVRPRKDNPECAFDTIAHVARQRRELRAAALAVAPPTTRHRCGHCNVPPSVRDRAGTAAVETAATPAKLFSDSPTPWPSPVPRLPAAYEDAPGPGYLSKSHSCFEHLEWG